MSKLIKFIATGDAHVGWERRGGRLVPIHDFKAWQAVCEFARDFKPTAWIEGGDGLDMGPISHWTKDKPFAQVNLPIYREIEFYDAEYLKRMDELTVGRTPEKHWHAGNHLRFLEDFVEKHPGLEGVLSIERELKLKERGWKVFHSNSEPHVSRLGKLWFTHGDKLAGGGATAAKRAVEQYERCIRIFHHHTFQVATKVSAVDIKDRKTGMVVPCLCSRNPSYARNRPQAWVNGFLYGYVFPDGSFCDVPVIITGGRFAAEGKVYTG